MRRSVGIFSGAREHRHDGVELRDREVAHTDPDVVEDGYAAILRGFIALG